MLEFLLLCLGCSLQHCSFIVDNVDNVESMKEICSFECDNISLTNIKSASADTFWDIARINNQDEPMFASFTDCDFSQSKTFIEFNHGTVVETTITITNTSIGGGFKTLSGAKEIIISDCVINITNISKESNELSAICVIFKNCKFVGKNMNLESALFDFYLYLGIDGYAIEFIDCEFDLDEDWNSYDLEFDSPSKQFIVVNNPSDFTINISFVRCYPGENQKGKSLKLIKVVNAAANEANINIVGEDVGMPIEWSVVDSEDDLYKESEWTVKIDSNGYIPHPPAESVESMESIEAESSGETSTSGNSDEGDAKSSDKEALWRIIAIVFIPLFVVSVVIFVVLILIKKKKYDRSENE